MMAGEVGYALAPCLDGVPLGKWCKGSSCITAAYRYGNSLRRGAT